MICEFSKIIPIAKKKPIIKYSMRNYPDNKKGWMRFIYALQKGAKSSTGFPVNYLIKVCIPIDKNQKVWVDDQCALDDCGPF